MDQLFKDLKVVELAGVLAGPSVGYFFAELGASVIKIENPNTIFYLSLIKLNKNTGI